MISLVLALATAHAWKPPVGRVASANAVARQEPVRSAFVGGMQVYPFGDGAIYRIYTAPERVTDIVLQAGESLVSVAAGDTARWGISDTSSGDGEAKRTHILVKPFAADLHTNLVILTDKRSYHLELEADEKTAMSAISWTYPADDMLAVKRAQARIEATAPIAADLAIERLRFGYVISGDNPHWRPIRAFDDGRQTFIELPAAIAVGEAPPLFILGPKGEAQLVNYRQRGRFYVVDRLFDAAELRLGEKPQMVVRISREGMPKRKGRSS